MTILLRHARADDLDALAAVFVSAFRHGYADLLAADVLDEITRPVVLAWFEGWGPERVTTVAVREGRPVGFVRYGDEVPTDGDEEASPVIADPSIGYVASLYVDPAAAGGGIGRRLLGRALDELAAGGRSSVRLWVFRDNPRARAVYERAGFTPDGVDRIDPRWGVVQIRLARRLSGSGGPRTRR